MTKNLISCFGTFQNLKKLLSVIFEVSIFELAKTQSFMLREEKKSWVQKYVYMGIFWTRIF